ncbi:MAG: cyclopropane fatty acyl phospholipid synthase [Terrimicrobiaceae bacterium]|nr:cyclopropane fatty acyl phospholipid synthase [Terrimicrobiaceae bacterium]
MKEASDSLCAGMVAEVACERPQRVSLTQASLRDFLACADICIGGQRPWDIQVHDDRFYRRVVAERTLGFGESYVDGWWDCEALDEMCWRAIRAGLEERIPLNLRTLACVASAVVFNLQTRHRARRVGERHYDIGNDFFEAMLDPAMQYSCAYFRETADLAEAQRQKLDLICRKLDLRAGMRLLDIGCGWGGLAKHAARRHGCEVVGITISREQCAYARAACRGLPVEIRLQDYRDVREAFDRVVSVGMLEHVGCKNYRTYFTTAHRCLRKGGLFLCQTIGSNRSTTHTDPWITRYIFPNSMLPSAAQVARAIEGLLVLEDVHNFGADYDRTLLAWERNFEDSWDRFAGRYGERFRRMWRFYLLSCAGAFRARSIQLYQFLLSKGGIEGGFSPVR